MDSSIRDDSDEALVLRLDELRRRESGALPDLLACLAEVERRGVHIDRAYSSLFDYCVGRLRYSEGAAMRRIGSARAASRFPALYTLIRDGNLSLTAVSRLEPHLTPDNFDSVVSRAVGKRQREIEALIVELAEERRAAESKPEPASPETETPEIPLFGAGAERPEPAAPVAPAAPRRDTIRLVAPGIVRFSFQADERLRRDLDRLKDLLKRSCAGGRLEAILARAVDDYLARHDPLRRRPASVRPARDSRKRGIPRWIKDRVWRRDAGRCVFVAPDALRCGARGGLELDHVVPWSRGGSSDDPGNIRLLCRAHNLHRARRMFGAKVPPRRG